MRFLTVVVLLAVASGASAQDPASTIRSKCACPGDLLAETACISEAAGASAKCARSQDRAGCERQMAEQWPSTNRHCQSESSPVVSTPSPQSSVTGSGASSPTGSPTARVEFRSVIGENVDVGDGFTLRLLVRSTNPETNSALGLCIAPEGQESCKPAIVLDALSKSRTSAGAWSAALSEVGTGPGGNAWLHVRLKDLSAVTSGEFRYLLGGSVSSPSEGYWLADSKNPGTLQWTIMHGGTTKKVTVSVAEWTHAGFASWKIDGAMGAYIETASVWVWY